MTRPSLEAELRDAVYRKLHNEARSVAREDWSWKTTHGNVERDRYIQGLKDAATIVLQVYGSRILRRRARRNQKRGKERAR